MYIHKNTHQQVRSTRRSAPSHHSKVALQWLSTIGLFCLYSRSLLALQQVSFGSYSCSIVAFYSRSLLPLQQVSFASTVGLCWLLLMLHSTHDLGHWDQMAGTDVLSVAIKDLFSQFGDVEMLKSYASQGFFAHHFSTKISLPLFDSFKRLLWILSSFCVTVQEWISRTTKLKSASFGAIVM